MKTFVLTLSMILCSSWGVANETEVSKALTSGEVYDALKTAKLDARFLNVSNLILEKDVHRFSLSQGRIQFFEPIQDQTVMALFVGVGHYELTPADADELRLLRIVHNDEEITSYKAEFDSALFLFTDQTFETLTAKDSVSNGTISDADKYLKKIKAFQEEELKINFPMRLARAMTNGGLDKEGLFYAFPNFKKAPALMIGLDPLGSQGLDFGGFRTSREQSFVFSTDRNKPGFWYARHKKDAAPETNKHQYVDALHYEVTTEITGFENVKGQTKMTFKPLIPELQAMPIFLASSLEIEAVALVNSAGEKVGVRSVESLDNHIFFGVPLETDETYVLTLEYSGRKVLYDVGNGNYFVVQRTRWYPNVGVFGDRADYKMIFKTPKGAKLVATGRLISEKMEDGKKITEWTSEEPMTVAGFNYGEFLQYNQKEETSGMELSVHHQKLVNENLIHNAMADAVNSVRLYNSFFGKLPYTVLAMTQQTQAGYGQAWPSLVFLPYISFVNRTQRSVLGRDVNDVIDKSLGPHEVAHQWFGHQVSAEGYRNVWLEEGTAEFAAGLLIQQTLGWQESDRFWAYTHEGITDKVRGSKKRYYEVAPIYAGFRMESKKTAGAYSNLVYKKGAFVMHMLRMMMMDTRNRQDPDAAFRSMMKQYFQNFKGQNITTEEFKTLVEQHMTPNMNATSNGKMDWFFNQWVYGTTIPEFVSDLKVKKEGDKYRVTGSISQKGVPDDFCVIMPVYVDFGKGNYIRFAALPFKGEMSHKADWLLPLPKKPKRVLINAHYDVLTKDPVPKK